MFINLKKNSAHLLTNVTENTSSTSSQWIKSFNIARPSIYIVQPFWSFLASPDGAG